MSVDHLPYRRGVGIALFNDKHQVFVGERIDSPGAWQMPQGGIDDGEDPLAAARRELHEETNVRSASLIAEAPEWLAYDLPDGARGRFGGRYRGQTQKWFLFRFEGKEREIDIEERGRGEGRVTLFGRRFQAPAGFVPSRDHRIPVGQHEAFCIEIVVENAEAAIGVDWNNRREIDRDGH